MKVRGGAPRLCPFTRCGGGAVPSAEARSKAAFCCSHSEGVPSALLILAVSAVFVAVLRCADWREPPESSIADHSAIGRRGTKTKSQK